MLFRNIARKYYAEAGEGGEGGGGAAAAITPEIQALIDARVNESVTGLKTKNSELLGKLKEQGENLKRYDGIDPDAVKTILQRFSDDEEAKLIAAGKIDEVLDKRTERLRADVDKKLKVANERAEKAENFSKKFSDRVLGDAIRSAALKTGALPALLTTSFCAQKAYLLSTMKVRPSPLIKMVQLYWERMEKHHLPRTNGPNH